MLKLKDLKEMEPGKIFATGTVIDDHTGINMTRSGRMLRWIAKRGRIHDWTIYIHFDNADEDWIAMHGDKINNEDHIKRLVACDDEAFKMYRH